MRDACLKAEAKLETIGQSGGGWMKSIPHGRANSSFYYLTKDIKLFM
jgi:hypothetical protein